MLARTRLSHCPWIVLLILCRAVGAAYTLPHNPSPPRPVLSIKAITLGAEVPTPRPISVRRLDILGRHPGS
jgi:hypothetical protein